MSGCLQRSVYWRALGAALLSACQSSLPAAEAPAAAPSVAPRAGEWVDVGGRSLHFECGGQGAPVVVLESGAGGDGSVWEPVLPALRRATTTCVYDRAGTGLSPAAPRPHTMPQMIRELHALIERVAPGGEVLLVGHSLGGLLVRLYESEHPDGVRGLVLVDPTTEEQDLRLWSLLPPDLLAEFRRGTDQSPEGLDYASFVQGMAWLRGVDRSLGDLPLVVLTAGAVAPPPPPPAPRLPAETEQRLARVWPELHAEVAHRSSNGVHVVLESVGHDIQNESPGHVIAAVQEVLASLRTGRKVAAENVLASSDRSASGN